MENPAKECKLVLLAKQKQYYGFHTKNKYAGNGWYIELCLIQKWFRDVHKIWVQVVFDPYVHYYYCEIILWNKVPIIVTTTHIESDGEHIIAEFDSWLLALEEGLQQALELI